jgi:hypothetical protein
MSHPDWLRMSLRSSAPPVDVPPVGLDRIRTPPTERVGVTPTVFPGPVGSGGVTSRETGSPPLDDRVPDVVVGATAIIVGQIAGAGRLAARVAGPAARFVLEPPLIPPDRRPARLVEALALRGRIERDAAGRTLEQAVAALVPALVGHLARLVPLTELIRQSIDLDVLVADVDLDAVAAKIDLDAVAARIDVDAILDRVDLTNVAKERLDVNAVVRTVDLDSIIDRLDLDALAARIDVDAILDRVDLTNVAKERLDVNEVVRSVDLDSIVDRLDLVALANEVIDSIDLPAIIRQSSGSLASETVRNVRIQSIEADRAVERVIDRFRPHRRLRSDGQQPGSAST